LLARQPSNRIWLGALYLLQSRLATVLATQHDLDGAITSAQEAVDSAKKLVDSGANSVGGLHDLAVVELGLGDLFVARAEPDKALPHHREAVRLTKEIAAKMKGNAGARAEAAYCLGVLGKTLIATAQTAEAREKLTEAHEIWLELRKSAPLTKEQATALAETEKTLSTLPR
jgi:tetratricopeptide (TPR) repeat protein